MKQLYYERVIVYHIQQWSHIVFAIELPKKRLWSGPCHQ